MVESHAAAAAPLTRRQIREAERAAAERAEREQAARLSTPTARTSPASSAPRVAHSAWDPRGVSAGPDTPGTGVGPDAAAHTPSWVPTDHRPLAHTTAPASRAAATSAIPTTRAQSAQARPAPTAPRPAPATAAPGASRAVPAQALVAAAHELGTREPVATALQHSPAARVLRVAEPERPAQRAAAAHPAATQPAASSRSTVAPRMLDETVVMAAPVLDDVDEPAQASHRTAPAPAAPIGPSWAFTAASAPAEPTKTVEPVVERPAETRPAEAPASEARPAEARPAETRPADSRPAARPASRPAGDRVVRVHTGTRALNRSARHAVRFGVVGALAAVTVAVPLGRGTFGSTEVLSGLPSDHGTLPSTVLALTGQSSSDSPPASLSTVDDAILAARGAELASRDWSREPIPGCDSSARAAGSNGLLAREDLCTLWDGHTQMRADAASALAELNAVYVARFGADMCIASGYRTLQEQYAVKAKRGGLAAAPGKSNHGWGLAIDFCSQMTTGARWAWLNENAGTYGFENPAWARPGGSGPFERWHWEYTKGVQADGEYYG
ncbi:M15 family metallopeptidase [Cellulomonas palmilytica]|uniref:M15 family metallopeptidase n=1 Tax=Cellulomonas palmilytica TaxID=2608402 RepID=UPI001F31A9A1|nr:M15 family metallopeptidase [Cellulomonas palmilytica]UJP41435.1 D-alanyl-D-alanine carboxypeptidase family protein [Cellulomonas palmilytica]